MPDTTGVTTGTYSFTLTASDYYSGIVASYVVELVIQPRCYFATVTDQTATTDLSGTYSYDSAFEFQPDFVSSDADCTIVYSCSQVNSSPDLCSVSTGTSSSTFDTATGSYTFSSELASDYPAGPYEIQITGQIDGYPASAVDLILTITIVNPCESSIITVEPIPKLVFAFNTIASTTH